MSLLVQLVNVEIARPNAWLRFKRGTSQLCVSLFLADYQYEFSMQRS